ncbi:uncharacterized protein I206_107730 [Kwoniella pini CBS 10737]|uniref:Restriction endonuclease type IV Mrr domain-containing protein n=1 Tax=Kwoniella pini CBS 10737 TaxID=1296096 RepID=A0A1B9HY38_9TREE|nr:uncharacterized protein I206_06064 [Kwoniella pini CBS 10737]OCF48196.1 hypothetical protein I206_06064 [Kwoniella pini CBS 10737]
MTILPKLKRRTTLEIGTSFEKHALRYLNDKLYMNLRRVGGAGDGGIDLRGWWWLPKSKNEIPITYNSIFEPNGNGIKRIRIIVQCKAEKKKIGPRSIRELEGVLNNLKNRNNQFLSSNIFENDSSILINSNTINENFEDNLDKNDENKNENDLGILISQSGFTKSTMNYSMTCNLPIMLIHLPGGKIENEFKDDDNQGQKNYSETKDEYDDIQVNSLWWNKALSNGILGNEIEIRRTISIKGISVGLWKDGKPLGDLRPT